MRVGEIFAERFRIERKAAEGGMGEVYRAIDTASGSTVALKVLLRQASEQAARFMREARLLAEIAHPGIVRHVDHGVAPSGQLWLAMEWLEGEELADRMERAPLDLSESLRVVQRVAQIVGVAHARGIVHRDLKPSNIFLQGGDLDGVKVLDFGIAMLPGARNTATGLVLGTLWYMAPEQARAAKDLDARADVFALGCVLFECLTGRPPFLGEHPMAILAKLVLEDAPRVRDLQPDIAENVDVLVSRMLAKDPADRPADGAALALELEAVIDDRPSSLAPLAPRQVSLTTGEQRLVSVVLLGPALEAALERTIAPGEDDDPQPALAAVAEAYGAEAERLADGSLVILLKGTGAAATDQASCAARCALAVAAVAPYVPVALATGLAELSGRTPVGEVIDRAVALVRAAEPGVVVDELTRGLLGREFVVGGGSNERLLAEDDTSDVTGVLLGRQTPHVGRERELELVKGLFEQCATERVARAVVITAPAGAGKSRLRLELTARLQASPTTVGLWLGRGDPMSAGSPFALVARALRSALGVRESEPLAVRRSRLRARIGRSVTGPHLPRVAAFVGELVGVPFAEEESAELGAARHDRMLMGDQMRRAFEDLIAAECRTGPVLLVLEDLQWGDRPTVGFVDAALRNLEGCPFMVLALARPEVHDLFGPLWPARRTQELRLEALSARACAQVVRTVLPELPDARVSRIVERAEGNAFFLEELCRAEAAGTGDSVPETLLAMVHARLDTLAPEARRVLRAASIFGRTAWRGGIDALLGGLRTGGAEQWLAWLGEHELLLRRAAGRFPAEEEWSFPHGLVREAAYESLTPADRTLGHRLAGEWLTGAGEPDALALAEHFERGALPERAVQLYARAAQSALAGNDFAAAVARCQRGVACGASGEALGALRFIEAEARRWSGEPAAAEQAATEALGLLRPGSAQCYAAAGEAVTASAAVGHQEAVVRVADWLLETPPDEETRLAWLTAAARAAMQLAHAGRFDDADRLLEVVDRVQAELPGAALAAQARVCFARALRAKVEGDAGSYLELCERAVRSAEEAGDLRYACLQRNNVGYALMELGSWERAERALRETIADAGRIGLPLPLAVSRGNLGLTIALRGDLREGEELLRDALGQLERQGQSRLVGGTRDYLAVVLLLGGDAVAAEQEARAAVAALDAYAPRQPQVLATLARALLALARAPEAVAEIARAMEILSRLGATTTGEAQVRLANAEVHHAVGDETLARAAIDVARARLRERARKIRDPQLRESFLTRVPENARTLELARAWLGE